MTPKTEMLLIHVPYLLVEAPPIKRRIWQQKHQRAPLNKHCPEYAAQPEHWEFTAVFDILRTW